MPKEEDGCSQCKAKLHGKQRLESQRQPQTETRGALPPSPFVKTCLACHANKVFEMNPVKSMWRGRGGECVSHRSVRGGGGGVRRDAGSPRRAWADRALSMRGAECSPVCKGRSLHTGVSGMALHQGAQTGRKELIPQAL